jgi:hypothetical protein
MPSKGQDDKSFISRPKSTDSISPSGPIGTRPKSETAQTKAEEILQAEIIAESDANVYLGDPTQVPIFRPENDGPAAPSPRMPSETRPKEKIQKSVAPGAVPDLGSKFPEMKDLRGTELNSVALELTDQGFTEIQPPLAVLAIAFLVLLFLL